MFSQIANNKLLASLKTGLPDVTPQPRIGQLDASILDSELLDLLKTQLWKVFKLYRPEIKDTYENELLLLLKLIIFKLTVWDHSATYGAKLQNLTFVDGRSKTSMRKPLTIGQKLGYGALVVGGDYLWAKLEAYVRSVSYNNAMSNNNSSLFEDEDDEDEDYPGRQQSRKSINEKFMHFLSRRNIDLEKFTDLLSALWSASSLFNFLLFLYSGRYSTLILRLLKIRLVPTTRTLSRQVNFEFQNRQLVWNAFTEFLLFVVPLINLPRLRRRFSKLFNSLKSFNKSHDDGSGDDGLSSVKQGELYFLPEKTCAICYKDSQVPSTSSAGGASGGSNDSSVNAGITNPYQCVPCGHVYCYVCLTSKIIEGEGDGWYCLRCAEHVYKMKPFEEVNLNAIKINPKVLEEVEVHKQPVEARDSLNEKEKAETSEESENDSESESESESENESESDGADDNTSESDKESEASSDSDNETSSDDEEYDDGNEDHDQITTDDNEETSSSEAED